MAAKNFVSNGQLKRVGGHTKKVDLISFLPGIFSGMFGYRLKGNPKVVKMYKMIFVFS